MTESEIMLHRFREICPDSKICDIDIIELEKDCHIAFEIVGYKPKNFPLAFSNAWENSIATSLADFIYDVWEGDK